MTEVGLFPRGKTSAHGDSHLVSKKKLGDETGITRAEVKKGRKRKATVSPLVAGSDQDKDWLFGAPQTKRAVATGGKSGGKGGDRQPSQPPARKTIKLLEGNGISRRKRKNKAGKKTKKKQRPIGSSSKDPPAFIAEAKEKGLGMVIEQPGRPPRLENVSFKNLSKGTLVLGVVLKVMTHEIMVSLPTGLTGVVHWEEVSDQFYFEAAAVRDKIRPSGNTSERKQLGERINRSIPLTDLFRSGQAVRCAVVDLAKKGGNRRIILSLRSSVVNKGLSMSQLGKGCGVCGSVASSEDHGYVVTLGLEGITAFLPTKYAPDRGLRIGQPVEAVVKAVRASAGTVTLSTEASLVASAVTSGTAFDLRSLKPGMLVDATVERVLSNGIVVSFLGSFAGCVDHNNMPVLLEDEKSENAGWRSLFKSRTGSVRARIVMVDYPNKAIRLTLRPHLVGMLPPVGLPPVGATLEGTVMRIDPTGLLLTVPSSDSNASGTIVSSSKGKMRQEGADSTDENVQADAPESGGVVGAFVHISRVAEEKVDDLEKLFKLGQKVSCRTTGSLLFEGWAAATINPSVVSSAIFRYQDLSLGATVEGTVTSVAKTGLVVKIGEGVQAWVPKMHVADVAIKDIVARFKVGAVVKGRVLLIDASRKKASLTLKPSMVKDKRHLIVSYKHVKIGAACKGVVIKVTRSYLHVGFYGNTFGVLSAGALALHGMMDPTSEFAVGQVVGCIVDSCDSSKNPPMLRLMLDVAGKTEEIGKTTDEKGTSLNGDNDVECPLSPGDIVTGTVAETQDVENAVVIHLSVTPKSPSDNDGNGIPSYVRGVLPYIHLGDHASLCNKTLVKKLTLGTKIDRVLVLSVDKHGVSTVSLKPLLISSVLDSSRCGGAFMPREVFDISYGDLLVGFVSEVKKFGVFVSFLGGFTGLCPMDLVGGRQVKDHRAMIKGDSVRCVVRRVNERIGQVTAAFEETSFPPSPALYIHSFLYETFAADPSSGGLKFGSTVNAKVIGLKKYGVVLKRVDAKGRDAAGSGDGLEEGAGRLMVCPPEHSMGGLEEGNEVKVRVLGVDISKGVVDVTMDTDLVKAGRAKRQKTMAPLHPGDSVRVKVVLAKPNEKWAVAASAEGRLFVLQVADFHCPFRTCQEAGLSAKDLENNKEFDAVVGGDFGEGVRGWYEAMKDESEGNSNSEGNLYSGALMIVAKSSGGPKQKDPELKPFGDSRDIRNESGVIAANPMDSGRVALDEIVKGTKVVCKVTAVKLERLEVEIAVGYPESDGPGSSKEELVTGKKGKTTSTGGAHKGDDGKSITCSLGPVDGSKTVRIRGRVHCTAAGLPGVDAPHLAEGDDGWLLQEWHPLQKYMVGEVLEARVLYTEDVPSAKAGGHVLRLVELAVVRRLGDGDGKEEDDESVSTVSDVVRWGANPPKQGQAYRGVIKFVTDRGVLVWLSSHIEGFIAKTILGIKDEAMFLSMFKVGMGVEVVVRDANEKRTNVVLSLQGELPNSLKSTKGLKKSGKTKRPSPGDIVEGAIDLKEKQGNPSVMVRLDGGFSGRVCFTELEDEGNWKEDPLSRLKDGERFKFRVLGDRIRGKTGKWAPPSELSLRSSRLLPTLDGKEAIKHIDPPDVFSVVKGYVEGLRSGGILAVRLDGNVLGRVRMRDLSDSFVANPTEEFPTGRLVVAKVLEKDETSGKLWLTLQRSVVEERLSWKSKGLVKGVKVKGRISAVKDFGVFVQLDHSKVHGLCHIEEISDHPIKDLSEMFHKGDRITAVILRIDARKRRLSLGLKESHFKGVDGISDKEYKTKKDHEDKENNDDDSMEDSDEDRGSSKRSRDVFESGHGNAFRLDFGESGSSTVRAESGSSSEGEEEDEGDSDDGEEGFGNTGHRSRKKAREKREEEDRIAARERALEDDNATPETVGDFERLLMASPNNSLLWVKYMAFKLSLADVEGARAVVERGLKAVSFRQERERFNLWVSYMNLEHKFGNRTSLKAVFERACENSDPKKVYLHLAEVHRKAQETEQCEEIFQAAVKKFRESHEVWMAFQLARIKRGDDVGARDILQRSLQSLRKGTHVMVISRYAQNEFEHGSIERGRLVFEGLLASYPKRVDIWNVYIAKEVKNGDIRAARNLHDRLTRMEFKARRMKGVFKSYLEFEMTHGDDAKVEAVKAKAKDYVMSLGV